MVQRWTVCVGALLLPLLTIGCEPATRNEAEPAAAPGEARAKAGPEGVVLFLGTSLTAGLGLPEEEGYPAVIQEKIDSAGLPYRVINAGVSGETSAGALRRLDWLLRQPFDVLVLESGANDMLRGADLDTTRANLERIIDRVRAQRPDARIVLAGLQALPNLGRRYGEEFRAMYVDLAREHEVELIPFLLEGVGGVAELNQPDGIHPSSEGQRRVAENVWPVLEPVLRAEIAAPASMSTPTSAGGT